MKKCLLIRLKPRIAKRALMVIIIFLCGWSMCAFAESLGLSPQQARVIYVGKPAFNNATSSLHKQLPKYILVEDQEPSGTTGGAFTSGAWYTRTLNTIVHDDTGAVILNGYSTVSVPAGTYRFRASAPAMGVDTHRCCLQMLNAEFSGYTTIAYGTSEDTAGTTYVTTRSVVCGAFSSTVAQRIKVQHRSATTQSNPWAMGNAANFGTPEIYTTLELWKVK